MKIEMKLWKHLPITRAGSRQMAKVDPLVPSWSEYPRGLENYRRHGRVGVGSHPSRGGGSTSS